MTPTPTPAESIEVILPGQDPIWNLLAVLLGAAIAAGVGYRLARLQLRSELASSNRREVYEPLLVNLRTLSRVMRDFPYLPILFGDESADVLGPVGAVQRHLVSWWVRMKTEGQDLRIARPIRDNLEALETDIRRYQTLWDRAVRAINVSISEAFTRERRPFAPSIGLHIARAILSRETPDLHGSGVQATQGEMPKVTAVVNDAVAGLPELELARQQFDRVSKEVDAIIIQLERHVSRILDRYEARREDT